jgi:hypothetical protein
VGSGRRGYHRECGRRGPMDTDIPLSPAPTLKWLGGQASISTAEARSFQTQADSCAGGGSRGMWPTCGVAGWRTDPPTRSSWLAAAGLDDAGFRKSGGGPARGRDRGPAPVLGRGLVSSSASKDGDAQHGHFGHSFLPLAEQRSAASCSVSTWRGQRPRRMGRRVIPLAPISPGFPRPHPHYSPQPQTTVRVLTSYPRRGQN